MTKLVKTRGTTRNLPNRSRARLLVCQGPLVKKTRIGIDLTGGRVLAAYILGGPGRRRVEIAANAEPDTGDRLSPSGDVLPAAGGRYGGPVVLCRRHQQARN